MGNVEIIWIREKVDRIISKLPKSVEDLGADKKYLFPYIQHSKENIDAIQKEFLELCSKVLNSDVYLRENITRQGIIGRYLDDSGNYALYGGWQRFMLIDSNYREWSSQYHSFNSNGYNINVCTCINDKYPELISYFRDKKLNELLDE